MRVIWLCVRVWSGGGAGCRVLSVERERERGVESIRREERVLIVCGVVAVQGAEALSERERCSESVEHTPGKERVAV